MKIVTQDWHLDPVSIGRATELRYDLASALRRDTSGARIHASLAEQSWDVVIRKGLHEGAYSGFDGLSQNGRRWPKNSQQRPSAA